MLDLSPVALMRFIGYTFLRSKFSSSEGREVPYVTMIAKGRPVLRT